MAEEKKTRPENEKNIKKNGTKQQQPNPPRQEFLIHVRLGNLGNKAIFLIGILIGGFLVRTDWISPGAKRAGDFLRGYEFDSSGNCVVMRGKKGRDGDWCRPLVNCSMCKDVHKIDVVKVNLTIVV